MGIKRIWVNKEKEKKMKEAQEIMVRYAPGRMIFGIGDQEFYLSEETAGSIFGRPVGLQFERVHSRDEDFGGLRSLSNYVLIQRLLRKGLGLPQIARVLNCPEERVRQFYGRERGKPRAEGYDANSLENEREKQAALEMDFVREARRDRLPEEIEAPEPGEKFVDLLEVRNLRRRGLSDPGVADAMGLDRAEFFKFIELNRRYLDLLP